MLFDAQQHARRTRKATRQARRNVILDVRNKGVDDRAFRDQLALEQTKKDPLVSLQKKAEIYEKLRRGETGDMSVDPKLASNCLVDFDRKLIEENEAEIQDLQSRELVSKDMEQEAERLAWERDLMSEIVHENKRSAVVHAIEAEARKTKKAREKVQQIRRKRKIMLQKRLSRIRANKRLTVQQQTDTATITASTSSAAGK